LIPDAFWGGRSGCFVDALEERPLLEIPQLRCAAFGMTAFFGAAYRA